MIYRKLIYLIIILAVGACSSPPQNPQFNFETAQDTVELLPGAETSFWLNLKREAGFEDIVNLQIEGLPEGVSQTWTRETPNGDCTVFLTASPTVSAGTFPITLRGQPKSGGTEVTKIVTANITLPLFPTFNLSLNPATLSVAQGQQANVDINIARVLIFSGTVNFSLLDAPAGVTGSFSPASTSGNASVLTLSVASTVPTGTYSLRVQGVSSSITKTVSLSLSVLQGAAPSFSISLEKTDGTAFIDPLLALQNRGNVLSVRITRVGGFDEPTTFKLVNAPAGVRGRFSSSILGGLGPDNTSLSITVDHFVAPGSYPLKVRVETETLIKVKNFILEVQANPLTLDANNIGQGQRDLTYGPNAKGFNLIQVGSVFNTESLFDKGAPIVLQSDGKAIVTPENTMFRYLANGSFDTTFEQRSTGVVAKDVALRSNGDIIVTGGSLIKAARFNSSGVPVTAFDGDGVFAFGNNGNGRAILAVDGGKILVAGDRIDSDKPKLTLLRLNADGTLDTTFSGDGNNDGVVDTFQINASAASTSNVAGDLVRDSQGRLIFAIITNQGRYVIGRRNANADVGSAAGSITIDTLIPAKIDAPPNLAVDSQNRILLLGTTSSSTTGDNFVVTRYKADGTKDTAFGAGGTDGDGVVTIDFVGANDFAKAILVQPDGKIVVAGSAKNNTDAFAIARLNANGTLDTTFGQGGKVVIGLSDVSGAFEEQLDDLAITTDGKIIASGHAIIPISTSLKTIVSVIFRFKP